MFEAEAKLVDGNGGRIGEGSAVAASREAAQQLAMAQLAYSFIGGQARLDSPRDGDVVVIEIKYAP
jgi:hypothetical protein